MSEERLGLIERKTLFWLSILSQWESSSWLLSLFFFSFLPFSNKPTLYISHSFFNWQSWSSALTKNLENFLFFIFSSSGLFWYAFTCLALGYVPTLFWLCILFTECMIYYADSEIKMGLFFFKKKTTVTIPFY